MKLFCLKDVIVQGKCVVKTRSPWLHRNFSGWKGWRKAFEEALRSQGHNGLHVIGRFFGHLVFCDFSHESIWWLPKIVRATNDGFSMGIGWLYWAVYITREFWYPNPRRYMEGFKDLPYASGAFAAQYYLEDHQEGSKEQWDSGAGVSVKETRGT